MVCVDEDTKVDIRAESTSFVAESRFLAWGFTQAGATAACQWDVVPKITG